MSVIEGELREPAAKVEYRNAKFGDDHIQMLPLDVIVNLRQMRTTVDDEALAQLKQRIVLDKANGELHYNLVHPITVNLLDQSHVRQFITDHDEYYEEPSRVDVAALPMWNGYYVFRIAGHMRGEAAISHCKDEGIALSDAFISAAIKINAPFIEANRTQNIENTRVEVSPVDDALSIERHYKWCKKHGQPATYKAVGDYFGYSEEKVRDALRFVSAPDDIKGFVRKGLSYTNVVDLVRLRETYEKSFWMQAREAVATEEEIAAIDTAGISLRAADKMKDYFEITIKNRLQGRASAYVGSLITAKINEVAKTAQYYTDELFLIQAEEEERTARIRVRRDMGDAALLALRYLNVQGDLSSRMVEGLEELLAEVRAQAIAAQVADAAAVDNDSPLF